MLSSLINQRLGRYIVTALLGRGGMAAVYRAYDPLLQRDVALKILYPHYLDDPLLVERFKREAITAAALEHPHIVPIYDVGEQDGMVFIAMKLLIGHTLQDILNVRPVLSLAEVLPILEQVAAALDYAHARQIVHRDIKPGNIMLDVVPSADQPLLDTSTTAVLTDFGIARVADATGLTTTGALLGTPDYMAPEQIGNRSIDGRVDVYALGMLTYRVLTGQCAFTGTPQNVLLAHLQAPPPPPSTLQPDLSQHIDRVILKALAKQPAARFATAGDFVSALRQSDSCADTATYAASPMNQSPIDQAARPAVAPGYAQNRSRRWPVWLTLSGVALLFLAAGGLALAFLADGSARQSLTATATTGDGTALALAGSSGSPVAAVDTASATATIIASIAPTAVTAAPSADTVMPVPSWTPLPIAIPERTSTSIPPFAPPPQEPSSTPVPPPPPPQEPSSTPVPLPTATQTAVPSDTPTVTSVPTATAMACAIELLEGGFGKLYTENIQVRDRIGCPQGVLVAGRAVVQFFESGTMYWWEPTDTIYVFSGLTSGTYRVFERADVEGLVEPTPDATRPIPMQGGFSRIYANIPAIRMALGTPLTPEGDLLPYGVRQRFDHGLMLFMPAGSDPLNPGKLIFVLYGDENTFTRYNDTYVD